MSAWEFGTQLAHNMQVHTQKGKNPTLIVEFENQKEKENFLDYLEALDFENLPTFQSAVAGFPIFGVPSDSFMAFLSANDYSDCTSITGAQGEPFAVWWDMREINTDHKRFQNRTNAFSELSAEQVANNYDENKLDPVIVWRDPKNQKIYILSGHSRHEGMRRRGEPYMPVRFFVGAEGEAIKFARIDANRVANKENLIEDLKAYQLSRDGDMGKGITPMNKADLRQAFKGKESKLEAWSFLNPAGKFLEALSKDDSISQFPRIQSFATWAGKLRKEKKEITDIMENDMFNYFYNSNRPRKLEYARFRDLVLNRLSLGKDRIFPECEEIPCKAIVDLREVGKNREIYKELSKLSNQIDLLNERNETSNPILRIYTDEEKKALASVKNSIRTQIQRLQRDLKILDKQPTLLGTSESDTIDKLAYLLNVLENENFEIQENTHILGVKNMILYFSYYAHENYSPKEVLEKATVLSSKKELDNLIQMYNERTMNDLKTNDVWKNLKKYKYYEFEVIGIKHIFVSH